MHMCLTDLASTQAYNTHSTIGFARAVIPYRADEAFEIALQLVFDHAKSQLPEDVQKRVIQRWQFRGHAIKPQRRPAHSGGKHLHGLLHCHTRDPPA